MLSKLSRLSFSFKENKFEFESTFNFDCEDAYFYYNILQSEGESGIREEFISSIYSYDFLLLPYFSSFS